MTDDTMETHPYATRNQTRFGFIVHHVQLSMPRGAEQECRDFWVDGLGFIEVEKPLALRYRGGLWVRADALEVHLGVEEAFQPAKKAHPGVAITNATELANCFEALGSPVTWDDNFPGFRRFHTEDNLGNRLEFMERDGGPRPRAEDRLG